MLKDQHSVSIDKYTFKFDQNSLEYKSINRDGNEISQIEKFLQRNYRDVNNLQSYLINELQNIENCKDRNKKVHKMIVSNIIPTFRDIKIQISNLQSIIPLLSNLAVNYIQTIYEKSIALLSQKQATCRKYQAQIEDLKRQVQERKEKEKQSSVSTPQKVNQTNCQIHNSKKAIQRSQLDDLINTSQLPLSKTNKSSIIYPKNNVQSQEVSVFRDMYNQQVSKPREEKLNKYQEVYQNILKSKKMNITYKCEKSPIRGHEQRSASKSPYQAKTHTIYRQEQGLEERKQYIKQKIQKIKLKAECKQYQRSLTHKQRFR